MNLNMLPIQYRRRQIVMDRLRQWSLAWVAALALAMTLGWFQATDCRRLASDLDVLEAKYSHVDSMQDTLKTARSELQELEQREALVLDLSQRRPMLSLLGILSQAARQCDGNVSVSQVNWEAREVKTGVSVDGDGQSLLMLQGIGVNNLWVAQFATALRNNEILRDLQLKSTGQRTVNGSAVREFQLECTAY